MLSEAEQDDTVLVLIQLQGGNDGLNTVIPIDDDLYHNLRPVLRIDKKDALALDNHPLLRLHPSLGGIQRMFNDGQLAIVENIGYSDYSLSHFTGTEIWNTGSGSSAQEYLATGWLARYLMQEFPHYPEVLPQDPPAIQISPTTSSVFSTSGASMGVALTDPATFHEMVHGGPNVPDDPRVPVTPADDELRFIQSVNAQALGFSASIREAALKANNLVAYPDGNELADALAIVARLIAGGLQTRIYMVSIGNFDFHANQLEPHALLLSRLGSAAKAFMDDLIALGIDRRVVGMTYSEFGRRAMDNGSGSDHGAAAPHFVFGTPVRGGIVHGGLPDLRNLDAAGNLRHAISFQCYYASVFGPLFGLPEERLQAILPRGVCEPSDRVPIYAAPASAGPPSIGIGAAPEMSSIPNPTAGHTAIHYTTARPGRVTITLHDIGGRHIADLLGEYQEAGMHVARVDLTSLPAGAYLYRINADGTMRSGKVSVVR